MARLTPVLTFLLTLITPSLTADIPDNLKSFYNSVRSRTSSSSNTSCTNPLAEGFFSADGSRAQNTYSYCGDHLDDFSVIYIQGKGSDLTNMDIDCDGAFNATTDDGRCGSSRDTQGITSFQEEFEEYGLGLKDLDASAHPYVVFGNVGDREGFAEYDPQWDGVKPLSLMAVVCGDKLVYGIWGDYNGDDGDKSLVGEASISLATLCYGDDINGGNGHDEDDVLYIAFVGDDAVPGPDGADWTSGDPEVFEESIRELGDTLVKRLNAGSSLWDHSITHAVVVGAVFSSLLAAVL